MSGRNAFMGKVCVSMIMSRAASPDEGALTPVGQNPHDVRAVTEFGERNEVVAHGHPLGRSAGLQVFSRAAVAARIEIERRTLAIPSCHTRAHQIVELLRAR